MLLRRSDRLKPGCEMALWYCSTANSQFLGGLGGLPPPGMEQYPGPTSGRVQKVHKNPKIYKGKKILMLGGAGLESHLLHDRWSARPQIQYVGVIL
jgi:hypothetical protein